MAYRKRTAIVYRNGRRKVGRATGKGPKHHHRTRGWWGSSVFNIHWLFGRNRYFKRG
jgi:hypothetical protein